MKGEADACNELCADEYQERLSDLLLRRFPEALACKDIRYAVAQLPDLYPYGDRVRAAQAAVAACSPRVTLVETADITRGRDPWNATPEQPADLTGNAVYAPPFPEPQNANEELANFWQAGVWNIHYNHQGRYRLGQRCANALGTAAQFG